MVMPNENFYQQIYLIRSDSLKIVPRVSSLPQIYHMPLMPLFYAVISNATYYCLILLQSNVTAILHP